MPTIDEKIEKLEAERAALFAQRKPIDDAMEKNYKALERARKTRDKQRVKLMESGNVDWASLLESRHDFESMEMYRFYDKQVRELGMWASGRWSDTYQPAIQIMLTYGDDESRQKNIDGVRLLMPFYKADKKGNVRFGIFDHGLSQYAVYHIEIKAKTEEVTLVTTRYGRETRKKIGKLEDAMQYLQEHHWYDGRDEDDHF